MSGGKWVAAQRGAFDATGSTKAMRRTRLPRTHHIRPMPSTPETEVQAAGLAPRYIHQQGLRLGLETMPQRQAISSASMPRVRVERAAYVRIGGSPCAGYTRCTGTAAGDEQFEFTLQALSLARDFERVGPTLSTVLSTAKG